MGEQIIDRAAWVGECFVTRFSEKKKLEPKISSLMIYGLPYGASTTY